MHNFNTHNEVMSCFLSVNQKEKARLDKFLEFLDESGVARFIEEELNSSSETRGRKPFNPYKLFATIIYSFSKHSSSVRKIEESMNYDLRFLYLMEQDHPTYVTISKFIKEIIAKRQREIYACIVTHLLTTFKIPTEDVFVDGTKLEANANKYRFVWKPTAFKNKLQSNIKTLLSKYFTLPETKQTFSPIDIGEYLSQLEATIKEKNYSFKTGKGIRSPLIVKDFHILSNYLIKSLEYEEQETICGPYRNSYFKTDHDATAMCLKEDYYSGLGSNMHAGYNVQLAVSKGIVLDYYVCQERNDIKTLKPFINQFYEDLGFYPVNICADSGYGSLENYIFIKDLSIGNFIKPLSWQQEMDGKKIPLYRVENNSLICLNNKHAKEYAKYNGIYPRKKNAKLYVIENCTRCRFKSVCRQALKNKKENFRIFDLSLEYYAYKEEAMDNLLSPKGIEMRINRSAQVEGAFGVIKQDMDYDRVRRRGIENVSCEIMLVCLGYVIRKLFALFDGTAKLDYWIAPTSLTAEQRPSEVNINKILAKRKQGTNEKVKRTHKYKRLRKRP